MYCSLEDAFPSIPDTPNIGTKERRKKRSKSSFFDTKLSPPEPAVIEPDRPAHRQLPPAELLGAGPTKNEDSSSISQMLNAFDYQGPYFPHPNEDVKKSDVYQLEPNWTKVFQSDSAPSWIKDRMASRDTEVPLTPAPWLDAQPTLWQQVPSSLQGDPILKQAEVTATAHLDTMQQKLDAMFRKLDDIEHSRSETNHIEIILFILGGIFLLLMLDLLVKQGTQAALMVTAAGGSLLHKGNVLW